MNIDTKGWNSAVQELQARGWTGTHQDLQGALQRAEQGTEMRLMEQHWAWGARAKAMVMALIDCTHRRHGSVSVSYAEAAGRRGPHITLSFPKGSRLQALQMQVKGPGEVYVVRRFNGDWRSCRTFRFTARPSDFLPLPAPNPESPRYSGDFLRNIQNVINAQLPS
jgi:hypothetical protein